MSEIEYEILSDFHEDFILHYLAEEERRARALRINHRRRMINNKMYMDLNCPASTDTDMD
jgi:hypothetical protein